MFFKMDGNTGQVKQFIGCEMIQIEPGRKKNAEKEEE